MGCSYQVLCRYKSRGHEEDKATVMEWGILPLQLASDFCRSPWRDLSSSKCLGAVDLWSFVGIVAASLACADVCHGVRHDAAVAGIGSAQVPPFASTWPLHRRLPQRGHLGPLSRHCWLGARQIPWSGRLRHYSWRGHSLGFHRLLRCGLSLAECLSAASPACRQCRCIPAGSSVSVVGVGP